MNYQMLRDILQARPRAIAFLAFLAVLNLGLFLYLSVVQRPELETARAQWLTQRAAASSGQSASNSATRYRLNQRDLALFEQRLIPKQDFASFMSRVFQAAKAHGLTAKGVTYTPAAVKGDPGLVTYGISFILSGKYPAVKAFIADLQGYREIVTLNSVALSSSSATEEAVSLNLQMTAYLKREGA